MTIAIKTIPFIHRAPIAFLHSHPAVAAAVRHPARLQIVFQAVARAAAAPVEAGKNKTAPLVAGL